MMLHCLSLSTFEIYSLTIIWFLQLLSFKTPQSRNIGTVSIVSGCEGQPSRCRLSIHLKFTCKNVSVWKNMVNIAYSNVCLWHSTPFRNAIFLLQIVLMLHWAWCTKISDAALFHTHRRWAELTAQFVVRKFVHNFSKILVVFGRYFLAVQQSFLFCMTEYVFQLFV